jgi:hypothetical protein
MAGAAQPRARRRQGRGRRAARHRVSPGTSGRGGIGSGTRPKGLPLAHVAALGPRRPGPGANGVGNPSTGLRGARHSGRDADDVADFKWFSPV